MMPQLLQLFNIHCKCFPHQHCHGSEQTDKLSLCLCPLSKHILYNSPIKKNWPRPTVKFLK